MDPLNLFVDETIEIAPLGKIESVIYGEALGKVQQATYSKLYTFLQGWIQGRFCGGLQISCRAWVAVQTPAVRDIKVYVMVYYKSETIRCHLSEDSKLPNTPNTYNWALIFVYYLPNMNWFPNLHPPVPLQSIIAFSVRVFFLLLQRSTGGTI